MDPSLWSKSVVLRMFHKSAHANIDQYFETVDGALDDAIGKPNANMTPEEAAQFEQDRLRLKLYAFATIAVENSRFECKDEDISRLNTWAAFRRPINGLLAPTPSLPFGLYDYDSLTRGGRHLGNHGYGMGERYKGRGFFQLTGHWNYHHFGKLAGIPDLALHPEKASTVHNAAALLAQYLLAKRAGILAALSRGDFTAARRLVNQGAENWKGMEAAYLRGEAALTPPPGTDSTPIGTPNVAHKLLP